MQSVIKLYSNHFMSLLLSKSSLKEIQIADLRTKFSYRYFTRSLYTLSFSISFSLLLYLLRFRCMLFPNFNKKRGETGLTALHLCSAQEPDKKSRTQKFGAPQKSLPCNFTQLRDLSCYTSCVTKSAHSCEEIHVPSQRTQKREFQKS